MKMLSSVRKSFDERRLERIITFNLNAARAHEANALPLGSPQYKSLYNECVSQLTAFSTKWSVLLDDETGEKPNLMARYPAMRVLKMKATLTPAEVRKQSPDFLTVVDRRVTAFVLRMVVLLPIGGAIGYLIFHGILKAFGI